MKKLAGILAVIAVLAGILYMYSSNGSGDDLEEIRTAEIIRDDLRLTVAAVGVVTPYVEVEVKSKAGGEIISFDFEEGDRLQKGQVAVKLDPEIERSRVNQANADLLAAEAGLEKAKINLKDAELRLERRKNLFANEVISRQDLDDVIITYEKAKSDVKIAEAELIRAQETLKEAEDRLRDTEITAPLTGTILQKYVEEGQVIASTLSSVSEGTLLFSMADLGRIYVRAMVDETDIGRIRPGQEVNITVDAYRGKIFNGKVLRVAPKGRVESTITVFDVTIEVDDEKQSLLKPMMSANVEVLTDIRENVLLVPAEAVRLRDEEKGVYRLRNGGLVWTPVKTGESDGITTEISGDIKEGDIVVTSGLEGRLESTGDARNIRRGFRILGKKK